MKKSTDNFENATRAARSDRTGPEGFDVFKDERLRYIVRSRAKCGDFDGARGTIAFITLPEKRGAAHCDVAFALFEAGDPHGANEEFAAARIAVKTEDPFYSPQQKIEALIQLAKSQLLCFGILVDSDKDAND